MADLQRTIEILFTATNRTGGVITDIGDDMTRMSGSIRDVTQPFADVTEAVLKLDAALAALAAAGIAYSYNESSKLQSAFTELEKVAGDNADALDMAKINAKELSNAYGESASDILSSTANFVQAGYSVKESMQLAKTGMDMVIAGGVDASMASEILIATLKGFKAPASDAGTVLDILNEVSNKYATDVEQLGIGMAGISPIARTMGLSFEETAGILTPVIEVFRSGDEASLALKTGLLKLIDDSKPVQDALASIGVAQRDANGNLRSGRDILFDVATAFQNLDEPQKLFITQQLVGIDQSARMVEVFNGLAKSTEITATAMGAAGSAAQEVAKRLTDPEVALSRLGTGFANFASAIGDTFQNAGTAAINGATAIVNALENAVGEGAFDPILTALDDFLNGIGETLGDVASNLPEALEGVDYSGFIGSLGDIKDTIAGIFDGIDFGDADSLREGIQRVVDALTGLVDFSRGLGEIFVGIGGAVADLIGWFSSLDSETVTTAAKIVGIGTAINLVVGPISSIAGAVTGLGGVLNTVSNGAITNMIASITGSSGLLAALGQVAAVAGAGTAGYAIGTAFRELVPQVDTATQAVFKYIDKYTGIFGVEKEHQRVQQEGIDVERRFRDIMAERAEAAKQAGKTSYESNLEVVNSLEKGLSASEDWTDYIRSEMQNLGILVTADTTDAQQKFQEIEVWRESTGTWETIKVPVDTTQVAEAKSDIEEIPAVKRLEIETDLKIEEIKAQAATIQKAMEFKAQINIEQIKADAEVAKAAFDSVGESVSSTADAAASMFSSLADFEGSTSTKWLLQDSLKEQLAIERAAQETQAKLTEAQAEYIKAKAENLKSGKTDIVVDFTGAQPHMEALMWEFLSAIQVRANEEGLGSLLLGA